jgi:hypothetical protein
MKFFNLSLYALLLTFNDSLVFILICHPQLRLLSQLLLSSAFRARCRRTAIILRRRQHSLEPAHSRCSEVNGVNRHQQVKPPCIVAEDKRQQKVDPCPVHHIPHILYQPLCIQILSGSSQKAIMTVFRSAYQVQVSFDGNTWQAESQV